MQISQSETTQYILLDRLMDKELQRLRQTCRLALERYMDVASDATGRLTSLRPEALSPIDSVNIARLARKEAAAHEAYEKAKQSLVAYLADTAKAARMQA